MKNKLEPFVVKPDDDRERKNLNHCLNLISDSGVVLFAEFNE